METSSRCARDLSVIETGGVWATKIRRPSVRVARVSVSRLLLISAAPDLDRPNASRRCESEIWWIETAGAEHPGRDEIREFVAPDMGWIKLQWWARLAASARLVRPAVGSTSRKPPSRWSRLY